jgi:hypothetical protein
MTTVQIDSELRNRLHRLDGPLESCDEGGRRLGYFVPTPDAERKAYEWARTAFSDEEIERARKEEGGFTLREILDELEKQ